MNTDYVNKFVNQDRKHLKWGNDILIMDKDFIRIENPQLLAAFIGYLKKQHKTIGKIYLRGERENHKAIIPSLYRGINITDEIIKNRTSAYNELFVSVPKLFPSYRFKLEDINPLLQHYGIKTNWIDLVDNLYIAIWFAISENTSSTGYIKVICTNNGSTRLKVSDLREDHSSLSLRPHCQHGISVTKETSFWNTHNIDFIDYLIATIEIPNNKQFVLKGEIFSKEYMFPNTNMDNTLKLFLQNKMKKRISQIIEKYKLEEGELGMIK